MSVYKDENQNSWYTVFYYTDWKGKKKQTTKRGFESKREAKEYERSFLDKQDGSVDMTFSDFIEVYRNDMKNKIREHTWQSKNYIIDTKILPYFSKKKLSEITAKDVIAWHNEIMSGRNKNGEPYSSEYLRSIHNNLSAIFNHAVRFYDLKINPAVKAGNMGRKNTIEMRFWTKEQYLMFADVMMDKPVSFYAFEVLYWCGIRLGELLALTAKDFDFRKKLLHITKSFQKIEGKEVITDPKTPKSVRTVTIPDFLCDEIKEYIDSLYGLKPTDRLFQITKSYLHHELDRGCKVTGLERIRLHDIRHSHVSLLIEMGFSVVAIADRMGHESIDITLHYAHMFPSKQQEMAKKLDIERKD
ncbi:MAG: site-specific integrase [Clostridia bacterium]|nr:site-specific integrase [Clostridia bacterium]